jgi:hypothetical protein
LTASDPNCSISPSKGLPKQPRISLNDDPRFIKLHLKKDNKKSPRSLFGEQTHSSLTTPSVRPQLTPNDSNHSILMSSTHSNTLLTPQNGNHNSRHEEKTNSVENNTNPINFTSHSNIEISKQRIQQSVDTAAPPSNVVITHQDQEKMLLSIAEHGKYDILSYLIELGFFKFDFSKVLFISMNLFFKQQKFTISKMITVFACRLL